MRFLPVEIEVIPIRQEIPEPFATHIREVLDQIKTQRAHRLQLQGRIHEIDVEIAAMQKHVTVLSELVVKQSGLPEAVGGYTLSDDGTCLTGEVRE